VAAPPQHPGYGGAGRAGHKVPERYINCGTRTGMEQTFKPKVEGLIAQCLICAHQPRQKGRYRCARRECGRGVKSINPALCIGGIARVGLMKVCNYKAADAGA